MATDCPNAAMVSMMRTLECDELQIDISNICLVSSFYCLRFFNTFHPVSNYRPTGIHDCVIHFLYASVNNSSSIGLTKNAITVHYIACAPLPRRRHLTNRPKTGTWRMCLCFGDVPLIRMLRVKAKLSLCLTNQAPYQEDVWGVEV
jgi:hypothetical protein